MERFKHICLYGCIGGLGLYIVEFICSLLPYLNVSHPLFEIWLTASISIGVAISVFVILFKRKSLSEMIFRFGVMVVTYIIAVIVNGYIGIARFMYDILGENTSSYRDNISGMLTLTFLTIVISVCIVIMIVVMIVVAIRNLCNKSRTK